MKRESIRSLLKEHSFLRIMEAHNGLSGLIVEQAEYRTDEHHIKTFDGIWLSSLCDSTAKGKPDNELVDFTSRLNTLHQLLEVTTKPIILDGDTGGRIEHLVHHIRTLERLNVSAIIIEDKIGLKRNSLFGTEVEQTQDSIDHFQEKIRACKQAQCGEEFMVFARVESLILNKGIDDALTRATAYVEAGADGIFIHSRARTPEEIFNFVTAFRELYESVPIAVAPSTFHSVKEEELRVAGINIVIYANHLVRSAFPAMKNVAESILKHGRALEADSNCIPIQEMIRLI